MTLSALQGVTTTLRTVLADLDPERLSGEDAAKLLTTFAEIEKLAAGGKLLAARRVESSRVWRRSGHRSAAALVAETTGTGIGPALTALEAARSLQSLPATDEAVRSGRLSETQVKEIASAAIVAPEAEEELVAAAGGGQPLNVLKLRCRRVKATGQDAATRYAAIHRTRYLRHWTDDDGAVRFDARLTPDAGAKVLSALDALRRPAGPGESAQAQAADALVTLATAEPGQAPGAVVHVRVDHGALVRGHLEAGEICAIPGIGPIPVEVARELASDSLLSVLVSDGADVRAISTARRTIPTAIRRALQERDERCVVPGCEVRTALEIDHVVPFAEGGPTALDNLALLCHWHHYLKTHHRHLLERSRGEWRWTAPPEFLTPVHRRTG